MKNHSSSTLAGCLLALLCGLPASQARAQADLQLTGYHVGDDDQAPANDSTYRHGDDSSANAGPVRLARFSYVKGDVTWRPDESTDWSDASVNLPVRQGAQFWVNGHSRAELQFDDGSYLRLGAGAVVTIQTLYSDADGEFTELRVTQGVASLRLLHADSTFQIDTPNASIKTAGPARVRVGVGGDTEVAVREGSADVQDDADHQTLQSGDYVDINDASDTLQITGMPGSDGWDRFVAERDRLLDHPDQHVPQQIGLCAGNLGDYGTWRDDPRYGSVWVPTVADPDWRPYQAGHWVWVDPFGWTWVSSEPWGWAPYHYGTWVCEPYGWAWCPGPRVQYWSPAVVSFTTCNDQIAWAPLCPEEVRYPSVLAIGFHHDNWWASFSIGSCAVYSPVTDDYCEPRPWHNVVVNRVTNIYNTTIIENNPRPVLPVHPIHPIHFVPRNARDFDGAMVVRQADFGHNERFTPSPKVSAVDLFRRGRVEVSDATPGRSPIAGPIVIRPTRESLSATHSFRQDLAVPQQTLMRPVLRAPISAKIEHAIQQPAQPGGQPRSNQQTFVWRRPGEAAGQPVNHGPGWVAPRPVRTDHNNQANPGGNIQPGGPIIRNDQENRPGVVRNDQGNRPGPLDTNGDNQPGGPVRRRPINRPAPGDQQPAGQPTDQTLPGNPPARNPWNDNVPRRQQRQPIDNTDNGDAGQPQTPVRTRRIPDDNGGQHPGWQQQDQQPQPVVHPFHPEEQPGRAPVVVRPEPTPATERPATTERPAHIDNRKKDDKKDDKKDTSKDNAPR